MGRKTMTAAGHVAVIGLGPGGAHQVTPEASEAVGEATWFYGYGPYVDRLQLRPDQVKVASDNREEISRAQAALTKAAEGERVAVVSGGDPGVFAMAAAVCEAIEAGPPEWRDIELTIVPGVTAMLAVAARIGAPLGHDFCAISLSDNLKPWETIQKRLDAAAKGGFVIALYNPISKARPWQLGKAFERLRIILPESTPVIFGRAAGRPDEKIEVTPLGQADAARADMATCVIIGSAETRVIGRGDRPALVYTPRFSGPGVST
jgi:precorrin-3B C17-methyltransferase